MHCSRKHVKNGMFSCKSNQNFQLLGELIRDVDTDNSTPKFWATFGQVLYVKLLCISLKT
jgi:hypothetical protein